MMKILKHAINEIGDIKNRIEKSDIVYLFLDYDGTLTDIVGSPADALPGKELADLFKNFNNIRFRVAMISGRSLDDLEKITESLDTTNIILAGSHGSEFKVPGFFKHPLIKNTITQSNNIPEYLKNRIREYVKDIKNILIEDKPFSFAVHYRHIAKKDIQRIEELKDYLENHKKQYGFRYLNMKKVIEIMPEEINKGSALKKFFKYDIKNISGRSVLVLCIGDDITDEDLFSNNKTGINIKVTDMPETTKTIADYYLNDPQEVIRFLLIISHI